jgi:hypothetical protein
MLKAIGLAALTLSAAASAQITSYRTNNPAPLKGDADKIVCEKEEKIGTRLGARKLCLTVSEWNERKRNHQERASQIQAATCQGGEGQACLSPVD